MSRDIGYVYLAAPAIDGPRPVKIGWSKNPWSAAREGQRWTWFPLTVLAVVEIPPAHPFAGTGYGSLERLCHDALATYRIQREWFRQTGAVLELLRAAREKWSCESVATSMVPLLQPGYDRKFWEQRMLTTNRSRTG